MENATKLSREDFLELNVLDERTLRLEAEVHLLLVKSGIQAAIDDVAAKKTALVLSYEAKYGLGGGDAIDGEGNISRAPRPLKAVE